jgi:hypothetical protein
MIKRIKGSGIYAVNNFRSALGRSRPIPTVSGGVLTSDDEFFYRTFTASGTLTITGGTLACDIVLAGGGGAGGGGYTQSSSTWCGGGGGGGGVSNLAGAGFVEGTYTVVIGAGGTSPDRSNAFSGTGSYILNVGPFTMGGGGGDGAWVQNGKVGASGGGGSFVYGDSSGSVNGWSGTPGQGTNGASGAGGGNGGGFTNSNGTGITINGVVYGSGGVRFGSSAPANTGRGGGVTLNVGPGGFGGSGVLILKYRKGDVQ